MRRFTLVFPAVPLSLEVLVLVKIQAHLATITAKERQALELAPGLVLVGGV